jgi:hypothetical protein
MAFEQVLFPQKKKDRADSFFRNPNPFNSYTENSPLAFTGIARSENRYSRAISRLAVALIEPLPSI